MLRIIAQYEFLRIVKSKAFLLSVFGLPILIAIYAGIILLVRLTVPGNEVTVFDKPLIIVDRSHLLTATGTKLENLQAGKLRSYQVSRYFQFADDNPQLSPKMPYAEIKLLLLDSFSESKKMLLENKAESILVIPKSFLKKGRLKLYSAVDSGFSSLKLQRVIDYILLETLMLSNTLDRNIMKRLIKPPKFERYEVESDGSYSKVSGWTGRLGKIFPIAVSVIFIFAVLTNCDLLLRSVTREKQSKLIEVLLSSVTTNTLLLGKVLGILAASLLEITVWLTMLGIIPLVIALSAKRDLDFEFDWAIMLYAFPFAILGMLLYGSLVAGFGSFGMHERQVKTPFILVYLISMTPLFSFPSLIDSPDGLWSRFISIFPLFSPTGMPARLSFSTNIPLWEIGASLLVLIGTVWLTLRLSGRLFRVGILTQGDSPGLFVIAKALVLGR